MKDDQQKKKKGYFRLGKALIAMNRIDEAYQEFYKGLKFDPQNTELKKILEETFRDVQFNTESDPRAKIENKIIKLYFEVIKKSFRSILKEIFKKKKTHTGTIFEIEPSPLFNVGIHLQRF